jgi:hypothetical protein
MMKRELILSLGLVIGLSQFALADEPVSLSPQTLGTVEAILDRCAALDPKHAEQYHDQVRLVTQGANREAVEKAHSSDEYNQAYDSAADSLGKLPAADTRKTCTGSLINGVKASGDDGHKGSRDDGK